MSNAYKHNPEYPHEPLDPDVRKAVYEAYVEIADITVDNERRPNGMYASEHYRFDRNEFMNEIGTQVHIGALAVWQAMTELKILRVADFTNVYTAVIRPEAMLFTGGYQEEHAREAFRFSDTSSRQYYWYGSAGAIREQRDQLEAYQLLKDSDRLNKSPTIPRHIGQFLPSRDVR